MDNGKNFGDQNLELWCGCKNSTMVDNGEGQIGCQKCGIILYEDNVDRENYLMDQTQDNIHHSQADYTDDNHGLGQQKLTEGEYKKLGIEHYTDYRITKSTLTYDEVKRNDVFQELKNICKKVKYSKRIVKDACVDYEKIEHRGFHKYKNNKVLAATSILRVCKNSKVKIKINNLCEIINEPREKLTKCYNDIHKQINKQEPSLINSEFDRKEKIVFEVNKMASVLRIPEILTRKNLDILKNKKFEQTISGSNEKSIAAGIMCIICKTNNLKITPEEIAYEFKISQNTVRNQAKKIATILGVELVDKRKKL
jgi:transcription initiation factor TFIIIB Brf1 subunit/transcription initiation factor TFIIB